MDDVRITRAAPDDPGEILTLQRAAYVSEALVYQDLTVPGLTQTLDELRAELAGGASALVARDARGRAVGSVRWVVRDGVAHVGRLVVAPDLQGRGIGTALLRAVEAHLPDAVERLALFTGHLSAANLRLYEREGYRRTRTVELRPGLALVHLDKPVLRIRRATDDGLLEDWRTVHNAVIPVGPLTADEVRERSGRHRLDVALVAGAVVGCSTVRAPDPATGDVTVIPRVLPEHRGRGYGAVLLAHCLAVATELGADVVETVVLAANADGLRFAVARGFVESERYAVPEHEGATYVHLRRALRGGPVRSADG